MLLKTLKTNCLESLSRLYPEEESQSFFYILCEHFLKLKRIDLNLNPNRIVVEPEQLNFENSIARLLKYEPIQYITGETEFYGLPFHVNKHTLIPRPETEELVQWIVNDFKCDGREKKILDVGTGSGCIAISLSKSLNNKSVMALDVSPEALKVTQNNAEINDVTLKCIEANILYKSTKLPSNLDVIVSNPPYVRDLEKQQIKPNVLDNEPHLALFVDDDNPLIFYKAISQFAKKSLNLGGALYFEINEYLGEDMIALLKVEGFSNIELKQDFFGKDRMIKALKL